MAGTNRGSPTSYFGPFDLPGLQGGTSDDNLAEKLTEAAEKFIESNHDRPLFLYLPEFAVHQPIQAREPVIEKYRARVRPDDPQQHPACAAMVESVDMAVGRVLKKLDEAGIADRTIVILTSDNGVLIYEGRSQRPVTSNLPLRAGKGHLYEGGIRVPLIIKWPGVTKGTSCPVPVCSMDHPGKARELCHLLDRWRRSVNATMPESNPAYDPAKSDQGLTGAQPPTKP